MPGSQGGKGQRLRKPSIASPLPPAGREGRVRLLETAAGRCERRWASRGGRRAGAPGEPRGKGCHGSHLALTALQGARAQPLTLGVTGSGDCGTWKGSGRRFHPPPPPRTRTRTRFPLMEVRG